MEHQSWKEAGHGLHIPSYVQKQVQRVRAMVLTEVIVSTHTP